MRLGLDHALVATRNLEALREVYRSLGFIVTPVSQHPWGTATSLLVFENQLFEMVSIADNALGDVMAVDGFSFGRHVAHYLSEREGVALTALNSENAEGDATELAHAGVDVVGPIRFGRAVTRADGAPDRTETRLDILPDHRHPRLSLFICQQFRRDLIESPSLMRHPNGVSGIGGYTVLAGTADISGIASRFSVIHGSAAHTTTDGFTEVATPRGTWRIGNEDAVRARYPGLRTAAFAATIPSLVGIDFTVVDPEQVMTYIEHAEVEAQDAHDAITLVELDQLAGVAIRFAGAN